MTQYFNMASDKNEVDETSFSEYSTNDEYHSEFGNVDESASLSTCNNEFYPVNKLHKSIIVSSPTGSGKTVIFELAIIHFLETVEKGLNNLENSKIIYVAPVKALCSERHQDWKDKFSSNGLKCIEITGDTEFSDDLYFLTNHQLIITTPEKWDSLTRKCKELNYLLLMVKLFLIDEVHLVNEGPRGATLETIVSRMKMISKNTKVHDSKLRFVAVSATVSNIEDIANWLCCDQEHSAHYLKSNEDERPVKLQKIVLGYNYWSSSFKFDLDLTYKLKPLIRQYSNGRPTLIFCPTRKSVELTCKILVKDITTTLCDDKQACIDEHLKEINNSKIKEFVKHGIGCHHAGMSLQERNALENLFRIGCLGILVATSTLAIGVNLPAHLVIIKSTEHYTFNGYREYNECQVLQMIGRAGRPQYDTNATAIIMTKISMKNRYEEILIGNQVVESHLHKHLIEHLNAEIFLGTIYDITIAMDWIRSTFLYVRACKVPQKYGIIKTFNVNEIERALQNLCLAEIKSLASTGLINNDNNKINSRPEGEIMAKYLLSFETMKSFMHLKGTENLNDMIRMLANSKEFGSIKFRRSEKVKLNTLNKNKLPGVDTIRFPIEEGINNREAKINCLIQATLGTLQIMDNSLMQDANKIIFIAIRLAKAIREITYRCMRFEIVRVACILVKCLTTRLWEQSKFVSKLIPKIGPILSKEFVLNGKTTLQSIRDTNPRDLERILNRRPPFGNHIHDFICQIPKYEVRACFDVYLELVSIKIILINYKNIPKNTRLHAVSVLVGDSDNNLLKVQQIRNEEFFEQEIINMTVSLKNQVLFDKSDYAVTVCLISEQWVGIDVEVTFKPLNHEEHVNESMSEDNHDILVVKSPLKTFSFPQPMKRKRTLKVDKNQKKDKTMQMNIEKYLHNVSSKDQDLTIVNKLHVEKNKDIDLKCDANESNVATQKIMCQVIETQTNSQNNKCTNEEYIKFDEDNLNKYVCYDELVNDDVFHDLFVSDDDNDDDFHVISKAFDSAIEKYGFIENVRQIKSFKNIMHNEVTEPMKLQCSPENNELLMNDEPCFRTTKANVGKLIETPTKYTNQYSKNNLCQLEHKENVNPYKTEQLKKKCPSTLKQEITSKQLSKTTTMPTAAPLNKFIIKKNQFTDYFKSIETNNILFSSRKQNQNQSDNVNDFKFNITSTPCESNTPMENLKTSTSRSAVVGRLSRRIKTNLKASTDFYVPLDIEIQSEVITDNSFEKNTFISMDSEQTRSNRFSVSTPIRTKCTRRSGKTMLDKYFKAVKTPRRLQDLNVNRFIKTKTALNDLTKNSVDGYTQSLNALQINDEKTSHPKISFGDEKLFSTYFSIHDYNKADSENSQSIDTTTGQSLRYCFPTSIDFKNSF